jgi:hypothetical protein
MVQFVGCTSCTDDSDCIGKGWGRGRLPVPGNGDVSDPLVLGSSTIKGRDGPQLTGAHQAKQVVELGPQLHQVHSPRPTGSPTVHLTIRTGEVADFVRVEVDADGEPTHSPRDHRIDIAVVPEHPTVVGKVHP